MGALHFFPLYSAHLRGQSEIAQTGVRAYKNKGCVVCLKVYDPITFGFIHWNGVFGIR